MSKIEWTHVPGYQGITLNVSTGCNKVSPGCKFCYAERLWPRLSGFKNSVYYGREFNRLEEHPDRIDAISRWRSPRAVFINSMSDVFHPSLSFGYLKFLFDTMVENDQHIYMLLTKRADRLGAFMQSYCIESGFDLLPAHIWMGVSVENQDVLAERLSPLLDNWIATRFLSCEPLLEPLDFDFSELERLSWVITGGESGRGKNWRWANPDWFADIRDQCQDAGVPFFHKQNGGDSKCKCCGAWGCRKLEGQFYSEFPKYLKQ